MIYLIYTAIIFEILFAIMCIIAIIKIGKKINKLNETITENRYKIRELARNIRKSISDFQVSIKNLKETLRTKRDSFILNLVKKILLTAGLHILFKKHTKQLIYAKLLLITYETIKNSIRA